MADKLRPMKAGVNIVFGDDNKWMPMEWQTNIVKMAKDKELVDMLWRCVDTVDDYFIKEKYGDDYYEG